MTNIDPNKNCHAYCPLSRMCRYAKGSHGVDPYECGTYYKLDDIRNEARDIEEEQRSSLGLEDFDDWRDYV